MTEQNWSDYTTSGVDFFKQSDYTDSLDQFKSSLAAAQTSSERVQSLHNMALAAFNLSLFKDGRAWLDEGLAIASGAQELTLLKACLLNTLGRYLGEFEKYDEADASLVQAIELARPINLLYACEMSSNLSLLRQGVPEWKGRDEEAIDHFAEIENLDQKVEIYLDLLGGFRVPSPSFDTDGAPNPEVFQTRLMMLRCANKTNPERREVAERILEIQKETLAVSPNMMAHVYSALASIAFENADYTTAAAMSEKSIDVVNQSYLRNHAISSAYFNKATTAILIGGDIGRAGKLLKDAEDIVREKCGENSAAFLRSKDFRLMLLPFVGGAKPSTDEQINNLEDSVRFYVENYPKGHSATVHMRLIIIKKLVEENKFEAAEKTLELARLAAKDNFRPLASVHRVISCEAALRFKQGRKIDGQALLSLLEEYAVGPDIKEDKDRIEWLLDVADQYCENAFGAEAERASRLALATAQAVLPAQPETVSKVKKQLGIILNRIGKSLEGAMLMTEPGQANTTTAPEIVELEVAFKEAMQLHTSGEKEKAAILAVQVINKARPYLPKTEQLVVMATSILIEQAKLRKDGPEIVRITSMLSDMPQTIRLRAIMPVYYKAAAEAFAANNDIKAGPLFEQAIKLSEETSPYSKTLDDCLHAYQLFCATQNQREKAAHLLDRLIEIREKHDGPKSLKYAAAISQKALGVAEKDPHEAEKLSRSALAIFAENPDADLLQHFVALTTAVAIATQLKQTEYKEELKDKVEKIKAKLEKSFEAAK